MSKTFPVPTSFIARYRYISNAIIRVADIKIPNFILFYTISAIYMYMSRRRPFWAAALHLLCLLARYRRLHRLIKTTTKTG